MNDNNSPNGMHPQDLRNLIIFLAASVLLWFAFDHFVMKPKQEAIKAQQATAISMTKASPATSAENSETVRPKAEVISNGSRVKIDTPQIKGTLSLTGARIDDIELKNYFTALKSQDPVVMYSPSGTVSPYYAETGWISDDSTMPVPGKNTTWKKVSGGDVLSPDAPLVLEWENGQGVTFQRKVEVDTNFLFTVTQSVENKSGKAVTLYPFGSITRKGIPHHSTSIGYEGPIGYAGEDLHQISYDDLIDKPNQSFNAGNGWIGFSETYWLSTIIPEQKGQHSFRFTSVPDTAEKAKSLFQVDSRGAAIVIENDGNVSNKTSLYVGVKKIDLLDQYESSVGVKHLDLAVDFGMLYFLTRPMYFFLKLFNSWVGNFGVAIIMLTVLVRMAVYPLANASYRSFAKMKKVAPAMAELRVKYATDKPKLQQELVKLYETEKVNPMAGCMPLILQIPIFFAVYKVISIAIEMRHAPFFGWIHDLSEKDPTSIFNLFGLIPYKVPDILHIGPWSIAMLIVMLIQQRLNPPPTDAIQKDMMRFMPWVMTFVLSKFPSGLVIYWTFSNLISLIQQYAIMKQMNVPVYLFEKDEALAHAASHQTAIEDVVTKAKVDKEYLKNRAVEVEEALFETEDKILDAAEGKGHKDGEKKF